MKAIEVLAKIDEQRHITLTLPQTAAPGPARVLVLVPETEETEIAEAWSAIIAGEWSSELADESEDIYTLEDGDPIRAAR